MNTHIETIQIGSDEIISFHHHEASGMVGESHYWTEAILTNYKTLTITELTYDQVKTYYNNYDVGKSARIKFFYMMRPMSPKAITEEDDRSQAEAISIVK